MGSVFNRNLCHVLLRTKQDESNDIDEDGGVFYDDFGGTVIGGEDLLSSPPSSSENLNTPSSSSSVSPSSSSQTSNSVLQERIASLKQQDMKRDAQLAKNWRCGNWKVRGFSLDTQDPTTTSSPGEEDDENDIATSSNDEIPIHISQLAMMGGGRTANDESDEIVAVARTDGSVVLMQLGTEYLAKFTAKLTATVDDDALPEDTTISTDGDNDDVPSSTTIRVESKLEKQEITSLPTFSEDDGEIDAELSLPPPPPEDQTPFEILTQFTPHQSAVTALLLEKEFLYTAGQDSTDIRIWQFPENFLEGNQDESSTKMIPFKSLSNAHTGTITSLHTLSLDAQQEDPTLLLSTASDGSFALWDLSTGDLVFSCTLEDPDTLEPVAITCADVDRDVMYLGLSTGHVVGYRAKEVVEHASMGDSCPIPNCRFIAHDTSKERGNGGHFGGVTAIQAAGDGTIARNRPGMTSKLLLTGGSDGMVKQWEILGSSSSSKLEHWPRMANQRMQRRAHLFKGHSDGPVTALACLKGGEAQKFLSAGADGTVRAWNPSKGTELFRMDGFEEVITSLCLKQDLLITNGMEEYVCIHDFDVTDSEVEDGYEIEEW
eukprot:CAMPEP_0195289330 /NCGR_PEP_ID=MMETSP0707-20130614/5654_1 /TAXON_ID=33640 /ORGANISM="Asterionellopsis glacialis, Strain CCMP134" /LENGTH=601 /DNA_ID=CAMNT_0040349323 /DNA_START=343 /DNA_END=2148 /DNA_ORIENTATION=+